MATLLLDKVKTAVSFTPSQFIHRTIAKAAWGKKAAVDSTVQPSFRQAAIDGTRLGLKVATPAGLVGLLTPAATRAQYVPTQFGQFVNAQNAGVASLAAVGTAAVDIVVNNLLDQAKEKNSGLIQLVAVAIKGAALYYLEIPALLTAGVHLGAAIVCGAAGATAGVLWHGLKGVASMFSSSQAPVQEAAANARNAANVSANNFEDSLEEGAAELHNAARRAKQEFKSQTA